MLERPSECRLPTTQPGVLTIAASRACDTCLALVLIPMSVYSTSAASDDDVSPVEVRKRGDGVDACVNVAHSFTIIEDFCGHGVGEIFHAHPCVVHKSNNVLDKMVPWQTFTIEPIL